MFWPFAKRDVEADLTTAQAHLAARRPEKAARLFRRHRDRVATDARMSLAHARAEMLMDNNRRAQRLFLQASDLAAENGELQVHANVLFHFSAFHLMSRRNDEAIATARQARALFEKINLLPQARAAARLAWTATETA